MYMFAELGHQANNIQNYISTYIYIINLTNNSTHTHCNGIYAYGKFLYRCNEVTLRGNCELHLRS